MNRLNNVTQCFLVPDMLQHVRAIDSVEACVRELRQVANVADMINTCRGLDIEQLPPFPGFPAANVQVILAGDFYQFSQYWCRCNHMQV